LLRPRRRADPGLAELIGHAVPSPKAARKFLHSFHDEALITAAQARRGPDYGHCVGVASDWTMCQPLRGVCER